MNTLSNNRADSDQFDYLTPALRRMLYQWGKILVQGDSRVVSQYRQVDAHSVRWESSHCVKVDLVSYLG